MMTTRCPHCGTAFRVRPEQIRQGHGQVRCGACMTSFDALASLAEDTDSLPATETQHTEHDDTARPASHAAAWTIAPQSAEAEADESIALAIASTIEPSMAPAPPPEDADQDLVPPIEAKASEALPAAEPVVAVEQTAQAEAQELLAPLAAPLQAPHPEARLHEPTPTPRRWLWWAGCLLALVALALQGAVHFRTTLAARLPESKPWLAMLCEPLGCALELPRRIDLIEIESSDLAPDPQVDGRLRLAATLRNRASFAQAWPHIELTLTSAGDRALLRRALAPGEYLMPPAQPDVGFPAGTDQTVQLDLQAVDTPAVGYRLYLFYP